MRRGEREIRYAARDESKLTYPGDPLRDGGKLTSLRTEEKAGKRLF
jgi:hypothetical protein